MDTTHRERIDASRSTTTGGAAGVTSADDERDKLLGNPSPEEGCDRGVDWRLRDKKLIESVRIHPRDTNELDGLGIFPSYAMLTRRLRRLRRRGLIRHQGAVQRQGVGRPVDYYCFWTIRRDAILHELDFTDVCDAIDGEWKRGRPLIADVQEEARKAAAEEKTRQQEARAIGETVVQVPKKVIWPDGILMRDGTKYYVEFESGEQRGAQIQEKMEAYAAFNVNLLYVTKLGEARLRNVVGLVPMALESRIWLSTYDLVTESPSDAVWYGVSLKRAVALPR